MLKAYSRAVAKINSLRTEEEGATAVEYGLIIALIAAVIIGGASFSGGEGSILGTLIGALMITILYMGGQQMGWPKWVQEMVIGGIIIVAVALDRLRHRKSA